MDGEYPPGSALPGERVLAKKLGVTRPTLRETLHRLAGEGWITIRHGKSTSVNDYWKKGGLGLLSTMARYGKFLPAEFITHLLELRVALIPTFAAMACARNPQTIADHLKKASGLNDDPKVFAEYDWKLQTLMAEYSENRTFPLILNDFALLFNNLGQAYFTMEKARQASRKYYRELARTLTDGPGTAEQATRAAMEQSIEIWKELKKGDDK